MSCSTCQTASDYCLQCKIGSNFFPLVDNPNKCYKISPTGYFLDLPAQMHKKCDVSCKTCIQNPLNCLICANAFYSIEGTLIPCFHTTNTPKGHYLDHTGPIFFYKKCYSLCNSCSGPASLNLIIQNCWTCILGYYKKLNDDYNCYLPPLDYYFLDSYTNILKPCYSTCLTCDGEGNAFDHKCTKCKTGYYFISGLRNCQTGALINSYWDSTKNLYLPCFGSCSSCAGAGSQNFHNCITCKDNFYYLEDNKSMCYIKSEVIPKYFFKDLSQNNSATKGIFAKCYFSCKTCSSLGDSSTNFCLSCIDGYYKSIEGKMNCYPPNRQKYYLAYNEDTKEKMFYPCYEGCLTCSGPSISNNNQCTSCDNTNYYFYSEIDNNNCFKTSNAPYGYFLSNDKNSFIKCNSIKNEKSLSLEINNNNEKVNEDNLKLLSIFPNFIDLTSANNFDLKFSNFLSNSNPKLKIIDVHLLAELSNGKSILYGLGLRGFDCNVLHVIFNPPNKIEGNKLRKLMNKFVLKVNENHENQKEKDFTNNNLITLIKNHNLNFVEINYQNTYNYYYHNNKNKYRLLQETIQPKIGNFKLVITNGNSEQISLPTTSLNIVISENKIPSFLKGLVDDVSSSFQNYITNNIIKENLISRDSKNRTIQVFNGSDTSLAYAKSLALENSLSFFELKNCISKITEYYNSEYTKINSTILLENGDITILKIDKYPKIINSFSKYNGYSARIYLYNSKSVSKEKIDLNICSSNKIETYLPVDNLFPIYSPVNITNAIYYNLTFNADIYNSNDPIYSDICFRCYDNLTDITLNERRANIYPNISISCSEGCEFSNFNPFVGYLKCICQSSSFSYDIMANYFDSSLEKLTISNLNLFTCASSIFALNSIKENYGLYFSIVIIIILLIGYLIFEKLFVLNLIIPDQTKSNKNNNLKNNINEPENKSKINNDLLKEGYNHVNYENNENKENNFLNKESPAIKKPVESVNKEIQLGNYIQNVIDYKALLESDGCYFYPIDDKIKKNMLKEFADNNSDANIDATAVNIILNQTHNSYNNQRKWKLKINLKKNIGSNNQIRRKIPFVLRNNEKRKIKYIAKFIKREKEQNDQILNAEPSLYEIDKNPNFNGIIIFFIFNNFNRQ